MYLEKYTLLVVFFAFFKKEMFAIYIFVFTLDRGGAGAVSLLAESVC